GRIWKSGDTRRRPVLMGRGLDGYFDIRALALCGFEGPGRGWSRPVSGGYGEGETPLPIPNRAVKPLSADGTWPARAWESRSPPVFLPNTSQTVYARRGEVLSRQPAGVRLAAHLRGSRTGLVSGCPVRAPNGEPGHEQRRGGRRDHWPAHRAHRPWPDVASDDFCNVVVTLYRRSGS